MNQSRIVRSRIVSFAAVALSATLWFYACGDGSTEPLPPPPTRPDPPTPATVLVSPDETRLTALGNTVQLTAEVRDQNGQVMAGAAVTWSSSGAAVATVNESGLATAEGNGSATITAAVGEAAGTAAVTVAQEADTVVVSAAAATLVAGDTLRILAEALDANGHVVPAAAFSWSSSDSAVATVDTAGLVTAVGPGRAVIAATSARATGHMELLVIPLVGSILVSPAADTIAPGDTLRLVAEAFDANGQPVAGAAFSWASSNAAVATVNESGVVRGVTEGTATLTATSVGARGTSEISVVNPDRAALVALYRATDGPNWRRSNNWLTGAPLGSWYGVQTNEQGRVKELKLFDNKLTGSIPPELGDLSNLTFLMLCQNELTGPIPPELGNLSNLTVLSLCGNGLTGSTPPELGRLSTLKELDVESNQLTGSIPPELGKLSDLAFLWLGHNKLSGTIPPELGDLDRLRRLDLESSGVTGSIPPELGNLSSLEWLDLGFNSLTGAIPPELGNLASLEWLDFERNPITGTIPPELGNLSNLNTLILSDSQLTGTIPPELGKLSRLEQLAILYNEHLTGAIPPALAELPKLRSLDLRLNDLTGRIPSEFGKAPSLKTLILRGNSLSGPIPPEIGDAPLLGNLSFDHNELSGRVPPEIGRLDSLRILDLTGNTEMAGALPTTLTALEHVAAVLTGETSLCAPNDLDFVRWLRGVPRQRVPLCELPAAYLVQAVQSRSFPVPLVAGEPALLRVFATATKETDARIPPVRATFYLGGDEVHTVTIPAKSATIPTQVDESSLALSSDAEIPGSVLVPGLEMVIEIDPDNTLDPNLLVEKRIPATGRASIDTNDMPLLDLTVIPLLWQSDPDSSVLDLTENMTAGHSLFTDTHMLLPVEDMDVTVHANVLNSTDDIYQLLRDVTALRVVEGGTGHWMGIMPNARGAAGVAHAGGGWTTVAKPRASTVAHELGHNMSLLHAPCGSPSLVDGRYPHRDGSIGSWGFDFRSEELVPPSRKDLLSYCPPRWIGGYHFSRALRYRLEVEGFQQDAAPAPPARSLLLWGGADADGVPSLEPAFVVDAPPGLPPYGADYRLVGSDADGVELFALNFDIPEVAHGGGSSSFAFTLPVESTWENALASVTLTGPGGSVALNADSNAPMAILRDPRTGQVRGILRDLPRSPQAAMAAARAAAGAGQDLEVLFSRGIPDAAAWRR